MRDINRAERLLSLFTSPESAAGIAGDLSEERGQRGRMWFWRQVLGTAFSLCRGALFASPVVVLLLVALGFGLLTATFFGTSVVVTPLISMLHPKGPELFVVVTLVMLARWSAALLSGAMLVTAAPRLGMVACALLASIHAVLWLVIGVLALANGFQSWWLSGIIFLTSPAFLLLGGAWARRRQIVKKLRTA